MAEMTDEQRDTFLAERRVAVLAIERPGKGPLCAPVWYRHQAGGAIEIVMADGSAKARLLRAAGRASICVQDEGLPYRYVTAEGPVTVEVMSPTQRDEILRDIAIRYLDQKQGNAYADNFPGHDEALVSLHPERWRSEILG